MNRRTQHISAGSVTCVVCCEKPARACNRGMHWHGKIVLDGSQGYTFSIASTEKIDSTAPAAPNRCPVAPLVEEMASLYA